MKNGETSVFVLPPIVAAMRKIVETLKIRDYLTPWDHRSMTITQRLFIDRHYAPGGKIYDPIRHFDLKSYADRSAAKLNWILAKNGFGDIRFNDFGKDGFGVLAIFDLVTSWAVKGIPITFNHNGRDYPGVQMGGGFEILSYGQNDAVAIKTNGGRDTVYMAPAEEPSSGLLLAERIDLIAGKLKASSARPGLLRFPMVAIKTDTDISWMEGLRVKESNYHIERALQQTKIKMDENGANVKSAVAMDLRLVSYEEKKNVTIDQPFLMWMERDGIRYFYGYFGPDSWRDPKRWRI